MNRSKNPIRARLQAKGNLFAFNRFISAVLVGTCLLTWTAPAYALRNLEAQESDGKGLVELLNALLDRITHLFHLTPDHLVTKE